MPGIALKREDHGNPSHSDVRLMDHVVFNSKTTHHSFNPKEVHRRERSASVVGASSRKGCLWDWPWPRLSYFHLNLWNYDMQFAVYLSLAFLFIYWKRICLPRDINFFEWLHLCFHSLTNIITLGIAHGWNGWNGTLETVDAYHCIADGNWSLLDFDMQFAVNPHRRWVIMNRSQCIWYLLLYTFGSF